MIALARLMACSDGEMLIPPCSGACTDLLMECAGKMQLVGIAHSRRNILDGHLRAFQQLARLGHAIMNQELLRSLAPGLIHLPWAENTIDLLNGEMPSDVLPAGGFVWMTEKTHERKAVLLCKPQAV